MNKVLLRTFPFTIASGQTSGEIRLTPEAGELIGCCIYDNLTSAVNSGIVRARLVKETGDEVIPSVNTKHLRNREAAYNDGLVPLALETKGQTFIFSIQATAAFAANYTGELVLVYKNNDMC